MYNVLLSCELMTSCFFVSGSPAELSPSTLSPVNHSMGKMQQRTPLLTNEDLLTGSIRTVAELH